MRSAPVGLGKNKNSDRKDTDFYMASVVHYRPKPAEVNKEDEGIF